MLDFYELRFKQDGSSVNIDDLMTEEEQKRVSYYVLAYERLYKQMQERLEGESGWKAIESAYKSKRTDTPLYSNNNREINVILPQIEGQVSAMTNNNIQGTYRGIGYSDQNFAKTAGKVGDFIINQNKIKNIVKIFSRRYTKFGTAVLTVEWDKEALNKQGIPRFECVSTSKVFVDDKVNDVVLDLESADFIIHEVGKKSLDWARREFGDEIANAIEVGTSNIDFGESQEENEESFTYLRVWTKNNDNRNLELLEISMNGILLRASGGQSPYYKHVFNRYPFFFAGMYKLEDDSYYFGDGYVLLPFQEYINKILDVILRAVEFSSLGRTFADIRSGLNPDDFAKSDPAIPIFTNNINLVRTERGVGANEMVFHLLNMLFQKVYEATRFSPLMTGNGTGENLTATQAGIQMQQGISGIDDKKKDLSMVFGSALGYAIGLCMQFWDSAMAFRVADDEESFEWIDVRTFKKIPEMIPASSEYKSNFQKTNPSADVPQFMQLEKDVDTGEFDEQGQPVTKKEGVTKELELDITVSIGEGLPSNKMAIYNMVVQLATLPLFDEETGQQRPLISYKQFGDMVETFFGISVDSVKGKALGVQQVVDENQQLRGELNAMQMEEQAPLKQPSGNLNISPNIPGANMMGKMQGGMSSANPPF